MLWYTGHRPQLSEVYEKAKTRIAGYPPPLNEIGLRYAELFNPVAHEDGRDYICTLLPFWLSESTGISREQASSLALANVYGMLYFFLQDDAMDGNVAAQGQKENLALGNLLHLDLFRCFRELFPSGSPLWEHYDRYVSGWADCVVNEGTANYFIADRMLTAGKAGPVKIAVVGACLLGCRPEAIPFLEKGVDLALATLQMLDDWSDWREDLADGSYNGLLAMIGSDSLREIESAIYVKGCMARFAEFGEQHHSQLDGLPFIPDGLKAFHRYMADNLHAISERLERNKRNAMGGGLNQLYFDRAGSIDS